MTEAPILIKAKSRKQLESQLFASIVSNAQEGLGFNDELKWVLVLKQGYKLFATATNTYPAKTIKELIHAYNYGLVYDPNDEYKWGWL